MKPFETVLKKLRDGGYEGYLVGGCVRDLMLCQTPHDYDVATNALPQEMLSVFKGERVIETGLKHGTITVLTGGEPIEVTTYRTESAYSDHRHPDSVSFTPSLYEDLARRDFTVNAMALSANGTLIDPFGGQIDLKNRVIRCVVDPHERFSEDALRILRALRFSSVLGFEIEEQTERAVRELAQTLSYVSAERTFSELKKLLVGQNAEKVLLENREVFSVILPPLDAVYGFDQNNPHHCYTLDVHIFKVLSACPPDVTLRFAALLHDVGKAYTESRDERGISHFYGHAAKSVELAREMLLNLKCDRQTFNDVLFLIAHHDAPPEETKEQVLKKLNRYGVRRYRMLIALRRADSMGKPLKYHRTELYDRCEAFVNEILSECACFSLHDLAIGGEEILALGVPPSKRVGEILELLLSDVMAGKIPNDREALIRAAKGLL